MTIAWMTAGQILLFAILLPSVLLALALKLRRPLVERLNRQRTISEAALNNMAQGLCMFDANHRLITCNRRYAELYELPDHLVVPGTPGQEMLAYQLSKGFDPRKSRDYAQDLLSAVDAALPHSELELPDGRIVDVHRRPLPGGGWVSTHEDVTESRRAAQKIAYLANHDPLTELPNRAQFRAHLQRSVALAERGHPFALHCLDLDHFKSVNDTLGHGSGDELLKQVAGRLRETIREGDLAARLGGDEFAIIQFPVAAPEEASNLAARVVEKLGEAFRIQGQEVVTGTSVGIAMAPLDSLDPTDLMQKSDLALYRAKSEGRGSHRFFEAGMDSLLRARRTLERELRSAIRQGQFELYYQPVLDLGSGEIGRFEALLRWHHPSRGLIFPSDFMSVAEESRLIVQIGDWVMREACHQAAKWPERINVAVNVSPIQFRSPSLVATISSALSRARLDPRRLELELTEAVLIENATSALKTLESLRSLGVRIAMDDFGAGHSSFNYLRAFPFDSIKIDRSFIHDLGKADCRAIVHATVELSQSLGLTTTAEGVETSEQLSILKAEGCTSIQGFLISHPLPADKALELAGERAGSPPKSQRRKAG